MSILTPSCHQVRILIMMRQKISTLLEPALFRQVKLESARRNKQISEILSEALESYFLQQGRKRRSEVVAESWASLPLEPLKVKRIIEEEEGLFDS